MWQLDSDATNASSGSTPAGSEKGILTTLGEDEAGTPAPPSNAQLCARLYIPSGNRPAGFRRQRLVAGGAGGGGGGGGGVGLTVSVHLSSGRAITATGATSG